MKLNQTYLLISLIFGLQACSLSDIRNGGETIHISHEGALMPVYLHGNTQSKDLLLVIHGGPGGDGLSYRYGRYSDLLEEELLVAYWDQRGQGMSQGTYTSENLSLQQMAEDLQAVVYALDKKYKGKMNIFLMGHSWGGMVGTKFMLDPQKAKNVAGWIEANGAHDIPLLNKEAIKMFRSVGKDQIDAGNSVDEWSEILAWSHTFDEENISIEQGGDINAKGFIVEDYLVQDGLINEGEAGEGDISLSLFSPLNLAKSGIAGLFTSKALLPEAEQVSLSSELYKIKRPCLFLYSQYDFVVPPALGIQAFSKVSSTKKELYIFQNSGHSPMNSEGELFASKILAFIARVQP